MRNIAVCSWSLQPGSAVELVERLRGLGIHRVQLALDPIRTGDWPEAEALATLAAGGIEVVSGMMGTEGEDYSTLEPGTWGSEVPAGTGEVDWNAFFDVLAAKDLAVNCAIEREAGDDRLGDIGRARELVEKQLSRIGDR